MYYVRLRGKVMGPFPVDHLKALVQRGQVAAFHELSTDGVNWKAAGSLGELFPVSQALMPPPLLVAPPINVELEGPRGQRKARQGLSCCECGSFLEEVSRFCPECGAEQRKRSFDSRSGTRLQPHRGGMILTFGILSLVLLPILGPFAWVMGSSDLSAMDRGTMDPTGRASTQAGYVMGIISSLFLLVSLVFITCWGVALVAALRRF